MTRKLSNKQIAIALFQIIQELKEEKLNTALKGFVSFLARTHRLKQAKIIINEFIKYTKKQEGIKEVKITAARKLEETTLAYIKKILGGKVEEEIVLDKSIIGGVKIRTEDIILDASVKTQLDKLKKILAN